MEELKNKPNEVISKKEYHKPQVEQVRLVLEDTVLGIGCKTTDNQTPNQNAQTHCALAGCITLGS